MNFIGEIQGRIFRLSTTFVLFCGMVQLFIYCIEEYQNDKVDKVSFVSNFTLLAVGTISDIIIIFLNFDNYYSDLVDSITNIILGCGILVIAIINFIRFFKDKKFILAFYSKYFLIASLTNIIVAVIYIPIFIFVAEKINIVAAFFSSLVIRLLRLGILSSYYLICREESYRYITIVENKFK